MRLYIGVGEAIAQAYAHIAGASAGALNSNISAVASS
jgi:hypothetical protein